MGSDKAKPAYVEDVDATSGRPMRDTRQSAAVKPKVYRDDAGKRERSGKHRKSRNDAVVDLGPSASQHVEIISREDAKLERRKSSSSSIQSPRKSTRPPSAHENRPYPKLDTANARVNPNHYGIPTPTIRPASAATSQPIPLRPRAQTSQTYPRPLSYHAAQASTGGRGPPISASAYYPQYPTITPSFPPPSPSHSFMQYAQATPQYPPQYAPQPQYQYAPPPSQPQYTMSEAPQYPVNGGADYFTPHAVSRPLSSRFDPIGRPSSAFESVPRTPSAFEPRESRERSRYSGDYDYYDEGGYTSVAEGTTTRRPERRGSIRVSSGTSSRSKAEIDSKLMPPPAGRPGILRRTTEYSVDPKSDPGVGSYYDRELRDDYDESRPRRPSTNRNSVSYDLGSVRVESANSGRRRQSWYDQAAPAPSKYEQPVSDGYKSKLDQAATYQEEVGQTVPLTAELLKRQQRRQGGSSRSTKSSASRDESDYKKSATTRTTRSGSGDGDENVTIKVTGQARVVVGGAQIDCQDGGEIEIKRNTGLKDGSERGGSEYGTRRIEDRRSRVETRPAGRSRMSSQSGESYVRTSRHARDPRDENFF